VLLSGDDAGVAKVWDLTTGAVLHTLQTQYATSVAFDASGALAAAGCGDGRVRLWDVRADWQPLQTVPLQECHPDIWAVQFSPPGARVPLLTFVSPTTHQLWDVSDGRYPRLLHTLRRGGDGRPVFAVAFSPDGALLASSQGGAAELWRVADGALLQTVSGAHENTMYAAAFHPRDASVLATCGDDAYLRLWQL
jgi:WD40 repeat protein